MTANLADASLLATKLFVPPPRPNRVDRARLRDRLAAARGGTVTLAAAAAGSGKSTLLADWALSAGKRVAWLSLDPEDDEPCRFLNYVIAALKNVRAAGPMSVVATSASPAAIEAVLTEVLNSIAESEADVALVLDDYHVIETPAVHGIVQRIIDHMPPNLHLVIASRVDPPLALSRLRARGTLLEIRAADLRFTREEAAQFFNEAMGLALTSEQVIELEERTEGWAVGLQMAAISLRDRGGTKSFISSFSGSNRYVLDYLADEVLHRQPEEIRSFLLATSILTQLSAPLCDAVTGRDDSERILRQLEAANLFLIPLDDVRFWYRYHHLFGSLLLHECQRSSSAEAMGELHRRAGEWYSAHGMPEHALHHAIASHDDDRSVAIVLEHAGMHLVAGDGGTIVRWISQLPRERVENDVELLILHARALTTEYEVDGAMRAVLRAEAIVPAADRKRYEGILLSLRGMLEELRGDERAVETLERAMTLLDPEGFWYSMTSLHRGVAALLATDLPNAATYLAQAAAYRDRPYGLMTAVVGSCYGGGVALWRGHPDQALRLAREAEEWIDEEEAKHRTERPLSSFSHAVLADVYRLLNDLDRARDLALRGMEFGRNGLQVGYCEAAGVFAQVAEAQGEWDAALSAARDTERALRCTGNAQWADSARWLEYGVLWRRGQLTGSREDIDSVMRWCREMGLLEVEKWRKRTHPGVFFDCALVVGARVLLHQERYQEAHRLLDELFQESVLRERVPAQISLLALRAVAESALGRGETAIDTMQQALEIASPPRFIRPLVAEGSAALPLIERAASRASDRDFALRVLSAFEVPVKLRAAPAGLAEPLSDREIEVLTLIAAGASNQAAARKLFVAPSTVKKHLENIYAKLGVGGRTQAVARARELHIL